MTDDRPAHTAAYVPEMGILNDWNLKQRGSPRAVPLAKECRVCHGHLPPGRKKWCSPKCHNDRDERQCFDSWGVYIPEADDIPGDLIEDIMDGLEPPLGGRR